MQAGVLRGSTSTSRSSVPADQSADAERYEHRLAFHVDRNSVNFGTYRCQVGAAQAGINPNQPDGRKMLEAAGNAAGVDELLIVLGQDPVTWFISGTKVANRFSARPWTVALAGGFRGKPVEMVNRDDDSGRRMRRW